MNNNDLIRLTDDMRIPEEDLFPGQRGVKRDHFEARIARSKDAFVRFVWLRFAPLAGLLNSYLVRLPERERGTFIELVLTTARYDFDTAKPAQVATREAFPLEWFNYCIRQCINPRTP